MAKVIEGTYVLTLKYTVTSILLDSLIAFPACTFLQTAIVWQFGTELGSFCPKGCKNLSPVNNQVSELRSGFSPS